MVAYYRPLSLEEALAIRAGEDVTILAGGSDVYPARVARAAWGDMRHKDILDISAIAGLRGIARLRDGWRIGALTTWSDLMRARLPPLFAGLQLAARDIGGVQIQNRGTLAGNICTASPAGDGAPNLQVLDASVELSSRRGRRLLPIAAFIDGYRHTQCGADEMVTAIEVPRQPPGMHGHFLKLGARHYLVIAIVMAAGVLEADAGGRVSGVRLAVGSCAPVAQRLSLLEAALVGQPLKAAPDLVASTHLAQLRPIDDVRASAAYRRQAAITLIRDLLAHLCDSAERRVA
jgi:N-methylhydantoinase B